MLEQIKPNASSTTLEIHKAPSRVNSGRLPTIQLDFPNKQANENNKKTQYQSLA